MIDAHHHLWRYEPVEYSWISEDMAVLRRDFLPADLFQEMATAGVTGAIAVQARQSLEETEWLLELASSNEWMMGVVGWIPLEDADVEGEIERLAANPKFKAVRHVIQDEPDPAFMLRPDFQRGLGLLPRFGLVYDLLIYERQLPEAIHLVDEHRDVTFVLDHIGKPRIRDGLFAPWRELIRELARRENVFCKISGMATEAGWRSWAEADLRPYWETVLDGFSPSRLMFGTDWPVLLLAGTYVQWTRIVRGWVGRLTKTEQEAILSGTAARVYGVQDQRSSAWCSFSI
jgi:L-fuconolactonase